MSSSKFTRELVPDSAIWMAGGSGYDDHDRVGVVTAERLLGPEDSRASRATVGRSSYVACVLRRSCGRTRRKPSGGARSGGNGMLGSLCRLSVPRRSDKGVCGRVGLGNLVTQ